RYAVRAIHKKSGFIFMQNFQDYAQLNNLKDLQITIHTKNGTVRIPQKGSFTLKKAGWAILPFNLSLDGINIKYSTTDPLIKLTHSGSKRYVFFSIEGIPPQFAIHSNSYKNIKITNCKLSQKNGITYIKGQENEVFSFSVMTHKEVHNFLVIPKR